MLHISQKPDCHLTLHNHSAMNSISNSVYLPAKTPRMLGVWQESKLFACAALQYALWSRRVVKSSRLTEHDPFHAGNQWRSRVDQPESARGKVQPGFSIFYPSVVCSALQWDVVFLFPTTPLSLFCFEILSCRTHSWAVFQPRLWRQQAERRPLIFLPKEFLALSLQMRVWLRLRYQAALSSTALMKLTGCFNVSSGRPACAHTHPALKPVLLSEIMSTLMPVNWIRTDLEVSNLHWTSAGMRPAGFIPTILDFKHLCSLLCWPVF